MDYYNDYRDRPRSYGRHDDSIPEDIDGPPPPGYPFDSSRPPPQSDHPSWSFPTFGLGREYHSSPPRHYGSSGRYSGGGAYSPDRGRSSRDNGVFPQVFPRMDPPSGYPDYGVGPLPPYGADYGTDYGRGPPYGDYDAYGPRTGGAGYGPEYDRGPHPRDVFDGHGHGDMLDFDRRPPPREEYEHGMHGHGGMPEFERRPLPREEFERRPPPREEFEVRPLPREEFEHGMHGHGGMPEFERRPPPREEFEVRPPPREEFEVRPPPREEFEVRQPPMEEFERRPPPQEVYPPGPVDYPPGPPPRHVQFEEEVLVHEHPRFVDLGEDGQPPMPYEPEPARFHGPHDAIPPPAMTAYPPPAMDERPPSPLPPRGPPPAVVVVDMETPGAGPAPPVQVVMAEGEPPVFIPPPSQMMGDGGGVGGEFPMERGMEGGAGAVPYGPGMDMGMGMEGPPPFGDPRYAQAAEHEHVRRKHFEGCKDYWAGFLFLIHFWAVVGVCIYLGVRGVIKTNQNNDLMREYEQAPSPAPPAPTELYNIRHWAPQLAAAAASGWLFASVWQWLVRSETMIKVCLSLGAVSTGLLGIILVSTGTAKGLVGLIFLVFALFQGLYVHLVRHRIPFAAIMLGRTRRVEKMFSGLHVVAGWTVFLAMFWLAIWIFGVAGAVSLPYGGWYAALLVVSLAWSTEVLRNIVYVTVAGVVGNYCYEGEHHMPRLPVLRAYQRAWTVSFGSVCLGSMFVAPVQTLHTIAKRLANEQGANEFLFSCVNCFLGVLDFFNRHFNKWAFVEVGLRGKSFVKSAKQTWDMFKAEGAMLLINDDLTGAILSTSCIIGGVLTALVGGCWTFATHRYLTVGVSILSFFIGFFVTYLTLVVPESAVASYYVCFAQEPGTLRKNDEPFWHYMNVQKSKLDQEID